MYGNLLETMKNLGSPKILVVGDFILDAYLYGDAVRISPEAPVPVLKVAKTEYRCGGAGSVAANLAALERRHTVLASLVTTPTAMSSRMNWPRSGPTSQGCLRRPIALQSVNRDL